MKRRVVYTATHMMHPTFRKGRGGGNVSKANAGKEEYRVRKDEEEIEWGHRSNFRAKRGRERGEKKPKMASLTE